MKIGFINGNLLKILGAIFMVIDHIGVFLFPNADIFRIIGRLSFPIFSFMIAEGTKYTRNKTKYFLMLSTLAVACHAVMTFYIPIYRDMSVLVTFSLSIIIIYALQNFKKELFEGTKEKQFVSLWLLIFILVLTFIFANHFPVDYGFMGIMCPVFASIFDFRGINVPKKIRRLDKLYIRVLTMGIAMIVLACTAMPRQFYSLLAIPLLLLYSEERGKLNIKYFFYIFYPLHIAVLEGLSVIV